MPVTFDRFNTTATSVVSSLSLMHTATSDAVMLIYINGNGVGSPSAVNYGGQAAARLAVCANTNAELWGLTAPAAGAATLSATFSAAIDWMVSVVTYTKVKNVGPFGNPGTATATAVTNFNLVASGTSTDLVSFAIWTRTSSTPPTLNNGTLRGTDTCNTVIGAVFGDITGDASTSISASDASSLNWRGIAVNLRYSEPPATVASISLLGAGF